MSTGVVFEMHFVTPVAIEKCLVGMDFRDKYLSLHTCMPNISFAIHKACLTL